MVFVEGEGPETKDQLGVALFGWVDTSKSLSFMCQSSGSNLITVTVIHPKEQLLILKYSYPAFEVSPAKNGLRDNIYVLYAEYTFQVLLQY